MPAPTVTITITERLNNLSKGTNETDAVVTSLSQGGNTKSVGVDRYKLQNLWNSWKATDNYINTTLRGDPELAGQSASDKSELQWAVRELSPVNNNTDEFDGTIGQSIQSVVSTHGIQVEEDDTEVGRRFRGAVTGIKSDDLVIKGTYVIASAVVDKVLAAMVSAATGGGADSANSLDKGNKRNLRLLVRKGLASIASDQSRGVDALTITERMMSNGN
jgi:hypothetical protein